MKMKRILACLLVLTMAFSCVALGGCTQESQKQYEVSSYQGQLKDGQEQSDYNKNLFYRNDKFGDSPDPFVLDNTARDGYYYL